MGAVDVPLARDDAESMYRRERALVPGGRWRARNFRREGVCYSHPQ